MNLKEMTDWQLTELQDNIRAELEEREEWPKIHTIFFHRSKDDNYEDAREIGLDDDAISDFRYMGVEVQVDIEVHRDGTAYAVSFEDQILQNKAKLS